MKNKKMGIALLAMTVFTTIQSKQEDNNDGMYHPKTSWPFAPFEDAVVGAGSVTAEVVTAGHADTGNGATGLAVAAPDAIPGVAAARSEDSKKAKNKSSKSSSSRSAKRKKQQQTDDSAE